MIVRIMGEGQFDVAEVEQAALQNYDDRVEAAVDSGDEQAVTDTLHALRTFILEHAKPVPDDYLAPSDIVIPFPDATLEQIRELLTGEGFIPNIV
ncbi:hypothetical protein NQ038_03755 [Brevibacterium sp. 50QC2O2]|uniref:PspA-associated protein PspAA n=1 Tax=Brevibacterium TaxID=1696 RepID=UPI00211CEF4F|nr:MULTISPECIES: hypothetical protein [unclassified Brevibacterium]MCQ9385059.1 hypothetical protein [Brevibacterium sp. 68QC2CO]MCQ9387757.1 hypothetical protein [Brevibacterium sp. 50QC2O2]